MEKKRMQTLAGINEGTAFKNGRFRLQRWEVGQYNYHGAPMPGGKWCEAQEVAKLEELAAQLLEVVEMTVATSAPNNLGGIVKAARAVIKKAKSL